MWIEPPPKPSLETEQALRQLANYYRQMIAYHQQSAAIASSKLLQTETLLNSGSFGDSAPWSMTGTVGGSIAGSVDNFGSAQQINPGEIIGSTKKKKKKRMGKRKKNKKKQKIEQTENDLITF